MAFVLSCCSDGTHSDQYQVLVPQQSVLRPSSYEDALFADSLPSALDQGIEEEYLDSMQTDDPLADLEVAWAAPMSESNVELALEDSIGVPFVPENCVQSYMTIEKDSGVGVDISPHDGATRLIGKIKAGPIEKWNNTRGPDAVDVVQRGDRITAVNGATGEANLLLDRMREDSTLHMVIRRLLQFRCALARPQVMHSTQSLGFHVSEAPESEGLRVDAIEPGSAAMELNRRVGAELEIRPGDIIVEVNDCVGDLVMLRALLDDFKVRHYILLVRRPREAIAHTSTITA